MHHRIYLDYFENKTAILKTNCKYFLNDNSLVSLIFFPLDGGEEGFINPVSVNTFLNLIYKLLVHKSAK